MKGGYSPVNQPWQGTVFFTAVLQNILLWTWKTPVSLWFMDPSGIWESAIHCLQPLIRRIQIAQSEWAARVSISTRRTWLLPRWTLLPTRLVFLQRCWVSILMGTFSYKGGGVWLIWCSTKLTAAEKMSFQCVMEKGNQEGALQNRVQFKHVVINPLLLSFKHKHLK